MSSSYDAAPPDSHISHADSLAYWNSIPANIDGMLGGYPYISRVDIQGSANFLAKIRRLAHNATASTEKFKRAVDCGAGIGRVTVGLLSKVAAKVDAVEPVSKFAKEITEGKSETFQATIGDVYITGLEDWVPTNHYDLIWNQWCLGHLSDSQLSSYLNRCIDALCPGGWIVIKENMSTNPNGEDIFDLVDSSVTRTDAKFRRLFKTVGLKIMKTELQNGFPGELFPVRMYALQPICAK